MRRAGMHPVLAFAVAFALGVLAERYRHEWQASAWAYERRQDRLRAFLRDQ